MMVTTVDTLVAPNYNCNVSELFAGAGGLMSGSGTVSNKHLGLNDEIDKLHMQYVADRPVQAGLYQAGDDKKHNFFDYNNKVDVVTGGFPCQALQLCREKTRVLNSRVQRNTILRICSKL